MGLNEREKVIYIVSKVREIVDNMVNNGAKGDSAYMAGRIIMCKMFKELGLKMSGETYTEILNFEDELYDIAGIVLREAKYTDLYYN